MNEDFNTGSNFESNSNLDFLKEITETANKLVDLFDRSIDAISTYGVGVAKKVKKLGIKFLQSMGFIDQELNQIWYIKNHLRDIKNAIENEDSALQKNTETLIEGLQEIIDAFVQRVNGNNSFYNNLNYAVDEVLDTSKEIQNKIVIK